MSAFRGSALRFRLKKSDRGVSLTFGEGELILTCQPTNCLVELVCFQFGSLLQGLGGESTALQCIPDQTCVLTDHFNCHSTKIYLRLKYLHLVFSQNAVQSYYFYVI